VLDEGARLNAQVVLRHKLATCTSGAAVVKCRVQRANGRRLHLVTLDRNNIVFFIAYTTTIPRHQRRFGSMQQK
jgi:hypothetical protein